MIVCATRSPDDNKTVGAYQPSELSEAVHCIAYPPIVSQKQRIDLLAGLFAENKKQTRVSGAEWVPENYKGSKTNPPLCSSRFIARGQPEADKYGRRKHIDDTISSITNGKDESSVTNTPTIREVGGGK